MQVRALRNIIYKREIYNTDAIFEMDDTSAYVQEKRGNVALVGNGLTATAELEAVGGLPSLDEEAAAKRKKK